MPYEPQEAQARVYDQRFFPDETFTNTNLRWFQSWREEGIVAMGRSLDILRFGIIVFLFFLLLGNMLYRLLRLSNARSLCPYLLFPPLPISLPILAICMSTYDLAAWHIFLPFPVFRLSKGMKILNQVYSYVLICASKTFHLHSVVSCSSLFSTFRSRHMSIQIWRYVTSMAKISLRMVSTQY